MGGFKDYRPAEDGGERMNHEELVKALRETATFTQTNGTLSKRECALENLAYDAADAIEELLPKRGEWIRHPEVKNIYGGEYIECPFCGEKYVVQNIADEKFCRNCGADMRMMEVQDADK